MTVAGVILVVFLAGSASALPVDPRLDRQAGGGYLPPDRPVYMDEAGKVRRPRFPDTPGLDQDEYNRYWQEMVKENPGVNHGNSVFSLEREGGGISFLSSSVRSVDSRQ